MKTIIIEDEELAARRLKGLLQECYPEAEVLATLESVADSVQWLNSHTPPDLIFLDIHLEDGLSFSIFDEVNPTSPVIFTTAFDEYAIKAFKLKSLDYLLKPIDKTELCQAIEKYKSWQGAHIAQSDLNELLQMINRSKPGFRERYLVVVGEKMKTVDVQEIAYFYSTSSITFLVTFDNRHYTLEQSLEKILPELDPSAFFRVNRQYLVNHKAIVTTHIYPKSRLKLDLNPPVKEMLFVSLDKVTKFKKWLDGKS
jgi:DNA-binding LytR/AlgR family response regulator